MDRRQLLGMMGLTILAACSGPSQPRSNVERITYGDDPSQFADLSRPTGPSKGVVVIIHGGFWKAQYDLTLGQPLAASLVENGWTAYNIEYRRVGNGGGWPTTFDDVAAAIDALADTDVDVSRVVTLGHSAGGHLAVWAAGRSSVPDSPWANPRVAVTGAISQAGVLDFAAATADGLGGGAVAALMGGEADDRYLFADPIQQVPLDVPVWCVHGTSDGTVPISQSIGYVDRATAAGGSAELVEVDGDHFVVIDPNSAAWTRTLEILEST